MGSGRDLADTERAGVAARLRHRGDQGYACWGREVNAPVEYFKGARIGDTGRRVALHGATWRVCVYVEGHKQGQECLRPLTSTERGHDMTASRRKISTDALYMTARGLADMGEDYGWSVYHKGYTVPPNEQSRLRREDDNFTAWYEAYLAAVRTYKQATGEDWRY